MHIYTGEQFLGIFRNITDDIVKQTPVQVGTWQSQKIETRMLELRNVVMEWPMPEYGEFGGAVGARLPWAEDHFQERVGGEPLNPAPSEAWWPFRKKTADGDTNKVHKSEGEAFSHTYPERIWPKRAGVLKNWEDPGEIHSGIRFAYGDLNDIVNQLMADPNTRQAYLPIWFPEDTGAVHGKRVPCTLGYHFQIRDGKLDISYFMRSTDLLRHFQDDVYMAVRLAQWVATEITERTFRASDGKVNVGIGMGNLIFHTANMHIFEPDLAMIDFWKKNNKDWF